VDLMMTSNLILELIDSIPELDIIKGIISAGKIGESQNIFVTNATQAWVLYSFLSVSKSPVIIVVDDLTIADQLFSELEIIANSDNLANFSLNLIDLYSSWTHPIQNELIWDVGGSFDRIRGITQLLNHDYSDEFEKIIAITTTDALIRKTLKKSFLRDYMIDLSVGNKFNIFQLIENLASIGYMLCDTVRMPGDISNRGGIVDVFPINAELPIRLDFLGNNLDGIRLFDPETQLSISSLDKISISPCAEFPNSLFDLDKAKEFVIEFGSNSNLCKNHFRFVENLLPALDFLPVDNVEPYSGFYDSGMLIDYFPKNCLFVFLDFPKNSEGSIIINNSNLNLKNNLDSCDIDIPSSTWNWNDIYNQLQGLNLVIRASSNPIENITPNFSTISLSPTYLGKADQFLEDIISIQGRNEAIIICSSFTDRVRDIFNSSKQVINISLKIDNLPEPGMVAIVPFQLREGFSVFSSSGTFHVITDKEIFGFVKKHNHKRIKKPKIPLIIDFIPGTYMVHVDHGIGRFVGVEMLDSSIGIREYLAIEYAAGDRLLVPMDQAGKLSSYVAPRGSNPSLSRLGTQEWSRTKERATRAAREIAQSLINLYASRQILPGYQFSPDTTWQSEFEDAFMYSPTRDQQEAIDVIKYSMESPQPMNYLVCGDVGYGKTEIAMRVAFKAVQDGKQVAVLCPTTLLAQQHLRTFRERFNLFPLNIEVLSRFSNDDEQTRILELLIDGGIDILIGTHKLLQRNTVFKDLGLVIVDDEQRFGVMHKEWLKQYHENVDVLTLTATPIPRTLSMALTGALDMVTVRTPPEQRQPIETHVMEYSDDLINEAISRELNRGGQVFFLHNRIEDIFSWANRIKQIVPKAKVCVAHSRLDEHELERVMDQFISGEKNVLICTTIIEAGLDIPNANTIIIHHPELLGLAQLYQLKGRVGRGDRSSYAYLLVEPDKILTETAEKRLLAMKSYQELGAGFRIAMKDLEIRGAGNILGSEQSGHMHSIGFDLYTQLLQDSIDELSDNDHSRNYNYKQITDIKVSIPFVAHIPIDYIPDLSERLLFYKRLSLLSDEEEILVIRSEMDDRFGNLPQSVYNIFYVLRIKILASRIGVKSIVSEYGSIVIRFSYSINSYGAILENTLGHLCSFRGNSIRVNENTEWQENLMEVLGKFLEIHERALNILSLSDEKYNQ